MDERIRRAAYELAADRITMTTDGRFNEVEGSLECGKCGAAAGPGESFQHKDGCLVGFVLTMLFEYGGPEDQPERLIQTAAPTRLLTHEQAALECLLQDPFGMFRVSGERKGGA